MWSCSYLTLSLQAPQGIKRNLQRTYAAWGRDLLEASGRQSIPRAQVLFTLAWFHSVVQERCTYIPQGWSQAYEFSDADLRSATLVLETLLNSGKLWILQIPILAVIINNFLGQIKWDYIYGLYEYAIYGGRVDNVFDLKVLSIYLKTYFNSSTISGHKLFGSGIAPPSSAKFTVSTCHCNACMCLYTCLSIA